MAGAGRACDHLAELGAVPLSWGRPTVPSDGVNGSEALVRRSRGAIEQVRSGGRFGGPVDRREGLGVASAVLWAVKKAWDLGPGLALFGCVE